MAWLQNGNLFRQCDKHTKVTASLKPGFYHFHFDTKHGVRLKHSKATPYTLPQTIYGQHDMIVKRSLAAWEHRGRSTGIALAGTKGSGKSLISKECCNILMKRGIPIIFFDRLVNNGWCVEEQIDLIAQQHGPVVVLYEEFDKVFVDKAKQEKLLSLFDGAIEGNIFSILSFNKPELIEEHFWNRLNRIYYTWIFIGLGDAIIRTVLEDGLNNQDLLESTFDYVRSIQDLSYDILLNIISEMNLHGISAEEAAIPLGIDTHSQVGFSL